ncbi:MAG TPA: hypothetical protein VF879_07365, partial [Nitrospirales bacterium]
MLLRAAALLLLLLALGCSAGSALRTDQAAASSNPALQALIREYIQTHNVERTDQLLAEILTREDATPATVSSILAA